MQDDKQPNNDNRQNINKNRRDHFPTLKIQK